VNNVQVAKTPKRLNFQTSFAARTMIAIGIHNIGSTEYYSRILGKVGLKVSTFTKQLLFADEGKKIWLKEYKARPEQQALKKRKRRENKTKKLPGEHTYKSTPDETGIPTLLEVVGPPEPPAKKRRISQKSNPELYIWNCPDCQKKFYNAYSWATHLLRKHIEITSDVLPSKKDCETWYNGSPDYITKWTKTKTGRIVIPLLPPSIQLEIV
jgi:hypothetical protein